MHLRKKINFWIYYCKGLLDVTFKYPLRILYKMDKDLLF